MSFKYSGPRLNNHKVTIAETWESMEELARQLLDSDERVFGFDTEMVDARISQQYMRMMPNGIKYGPTMMIQLATMNHVYLFHFYRMLGTPPQQWELPPLLQRILRSDKYIKVGIATHNDTEGLNKTFDIGGIVQLCDLRAFGVSFGLPFNSLRDVAVWCGRNDIDKQTPHDWTYTLYGGEAVRCDAIEYAALDAIVCRQAHDKLFRQVLPITPILHSPSSSTLVSATNQEVQRTAKKYNNETRIRVIVPVTVGGPKTRHD